MITQDYFKDWVTGWRWGVRIGLFIILLSSLVQLGMFLLTQNYMVGYLGAQPEDISFAVMMTYAGIITILPVQFRFQQYFETQPYLLANIILAIVLNFLCMSCRDLHLFFIIRFMQGILTGNVIVCSLIMIFSRLKTHRAQIVGSAVFNGSILSSWVLIGTVAGVVVESADWTVTYRWLIFFQVLAIVVVLLMVKRTRGQRRYPLYQVDWVGMIVFACASVALSYTIVYGSKYYWWEDPRIRCSACMAAAGACLFLLRQGMIKRPLIHPSVFRSAPFVAGICMLAVYYGSKDSINLVYAYAGGLLRWSALQVMLLGLCNIAGMVTLITLSARIMAIDKGTIRFFIIGGFALMAVFDLWMYFIITPDLSFTDLFLPVFVQGGASGFLFLPIYIYTVRSAPAHTGTSGLVLTVCARFTATLNSIAGFYNLQLYYNGHFRQGFLDHLTPESQNLATRTESYKALFVSKGYTSSQAAGLTSSAIWQSLTQQSQLLTYRAIFMMLAITLAVVAFLVMVTPAIRKTLMHRNKNIT